MSEEREGLGAVQVAKRFLVFLVVVALAGAAAFLFSTLHGRTFLVEQHENELWIMKGRELPFGFVPFQPTDKAQAAAYAPIKLMGDAPGELVNAPYDDRDALDQALFRTFKAWIEARLDSEDPVRLSQASGLLKRAELLAGTSSDQRDQLKDLKAKVAYAEGRSRVEDADAALREAVTWLKLAAESRNRYAREAGELYDRVAGLSEQVSRALRQTARPPEPKADPGTLPAEQVPAAPDAGEAADAAPAGEPPVASPPDAG